VTILSPVLTSAMAQCRHDLERQMDDHDFCADCPLLLECAAQQSALPTPAQEGATA
jgi:hypothetical protein